jgi:hypothetical protein
MTHTCIDIDVWCKWVYTPPVYRVYVDDELLTERNFIWETTRHYIREHIEVFLDPGWHEVRIENCSNGAAEFITNNIIVNGQASGAKFVV